MLNKKLNIYEHLWLWTLQFGFSLQRPCIGDLATGFLNKHTWIRFVKPVNVFLAIVPIWFDSKSRYCKLVNPLKSMDGMDVSLL